MTSSPISTRMPPSTDGVDHDVEVHRCGRTAAEQRRGEAVLLALGERSATRTRATILAARPRPRARRTSSIALAQRSRCAPLSGLLDRAARWPACTLPSSSARTSARLSATERAGSDRARAQLRRSRPRCRPKANSSSSSGPRRLTVGRHDHRDHAELLEAAARSALDPQRSSAAAATSSQWRRPPVLAEHAPGQARLGLGVGARGRSPRAGAPAGGAAGRQRAEQVVAELGTVARRRRPPRRPRRSARASDSAGATRCITCTHPWPDRDRLAGLEVGEEAVHDPALRSLVLERLADDPAGQRGRQRADLGAQRGDRLLAVGLDLGVRVLDDARRPRPAPARASRR